MKPAIQKNYVKLSISLYICFSTILDLEDTTLQLDFQGDHP